MSLTPDIAGQPAAAADALWLSTSEIARRKGVTKQTVSEKVRKLVADNRLQTKPGKGKAVLINIAEYDRVLGETTDLAREQGARTKSDDASSQRDPTFTTHQATRAGYEAELKRLDLEERLGKLRNVSEIEAAAVRCAETVVRVLEDKVLRVEQLAGGLARDGVNGLRKMLKDIVFEERQKIVKAFGDLVAGQESADMQQGSDQQ